MITPCRDHHSSNHDPDQHHSWKPACDLVKGEEQELLMTTPIDGFEDSHTHPTEIPTFITLSRRRASIDSCSRSSISSQRSCSLSSHNYSNQSQCRSASLSSYNRPLQHGTSSEPSCSRASSDCSHYSEHLTQSHIPSQYLHNPDIYNSNIYNPSMSEQFDPTPANNVSPCTQDNRFARCKPLGFVAFICLFLYTGLAQKFSKEWQYVRMGSSSNIIMLQRSDEKQQIDDSNPEGRGESSNIRRMKNEPQIDIYALASKEIYNPELLGYKDTWVNHDKINDIPVFWHVPKAGGSTIKDIAGACHGLTIANEDGVLDGHVFDTTIKKVNIHGLGDTNFVNVDTTTIPGIKRAIKMGLGSSGLTDLVITPFIHDAEHIFTANTKEDKAPQTGRLFATFRHPVARAISLFKYLQYADWEPTYNPEIKTWNLKQYAQSNHIENNWMTRYLSNTMNGELTRAHLEVAMDILRRKFLVGLIDQLEPSMKRFEAFFGWKYMLNPTIKETCRESLFTVGTNANTNSRITIPEEGSYLYNLIAQQNMFDLELYAYIETLFDEQAQYVKDIPEDYRLIDAQCSKCVESKT